MTCLGLSGGHDANWALLRNGEILGAYEKERYSRIRHDGGEVASHALGTLQRLGMSAGDLSVIATSEPVHKGLETGARRLGGEKYRQIDKWEHQIVEAFGKILPAVSIPHHLCHAAYAAYTSPFVECMVVTMDAGGDFYTEQAYTCATISMWKNGRLSFIEAVPNVGFGSLWFGYSRAIFGDGNHSGKLMGLAALGDDSLVASFHDRFTAPLRGLFDNVRVVKDCWPDYEDPPFMAGVASWADPRAQAIARAVQSLTTTGGLDFVRKAQAATGARHLALSGGVALNGYLTTAIQESGLFSAVHVPPAVNDGGIALGAALFTHHHVLGHDYVPIGRGEICFLGEQYHSPLQIEEDGFNAVRLDADEASRMIAARLAEGAVAAVYEGRSEHGPRALGNRSLLASASVPGTRDKINRVIKGREPFRPLAPMVLKERAAEYFDMNWNSPHMMFIVKAKDSMLNACPEGCHSDGTARVQTVESSTGFSTKVLSAYDKLTGVPVILNTSFNRSEPIVETPGQALETFRKIPVDIMWLDGWLLQKTKTC